MCLRVEKLDNFNRYILIKITINLRILHIFKFVLSDYIDVYDKLKYLHANNEYALGVVSLNGHFFVIEFLSSNGASHTPTTN
jgi:hypothetical protein